MASSSSGESEGVGFSVVVVEEDREERELVLETDLGEVVEGQDLGWRLDLMELVDVESVGE